MTRGSDEQLGLELVEPSPCQAGDVVRWHESIFNLYPASGVVVVVDSARRAASVERAGRLVDVPLSRIEGVVKCAKSSP